MDYKKKLEEAKELYKTANSDQRYVLERIFSELKEGKGEKIKNLIYCLIRDRSDNGKLLEHNGVTVKEALAWLEKQGEQKPSIFIPKFRVGDKLVSTKNPRLTYEVLEVGHINELGNPEYKVIIFVDGKAITPQDIHYLECQKVDKWGKLIEHKPADKVEPEFHKDEWVITKANNLYQITAIIDDKYQLKYGDNYSIQKCADVDKNARLWSIEDAIKTHAETYSFNIESALFPQLTIEQQKLWRKEIEQACISGGMYILLRLKIN